jgi:hypothetical protein
MDMKRIMKSFNTTLVEMRNTAGADINEIMFGFLAANGSWDTFVNGEEAQEKLEQRLKEVPKQEADDQVARAHEMLSETLKWGSANGWDGDIVKVWWTARPGALQSAVGSREVSPQNPTDILLQFADESFLGISAKSTKRNADVGFKNPGVGSIGKSLGVDLRAILEGLDTVTLKALGIDQLPAQRRKAYIRANPAIKEKVDEVGRVILNKLRDALLEHLSSMSDESIRDHLVKNWLDAGENYPYYVKVTGRGQSRKGYSASLEVPVASEKYKMLMSETVELVPVGNDSVGVIAGGKRIMKMRFKYESQKLASSLKMSGDPWK